MAQINEELISSNPWWKGAFGLKYKERDIYKEIRAFMPKKQIIALVGLRRVGKTTLLYHIANSEIALGLDPKNVLYFSFDNFKDIELSEIIKEYEKMFGKDLSSGRYLLLLDEIQKLKNWEEQVKRVYDRPSANIKIIISGSESLSIQKRYKESLAGRVYEFRVKPLSFKEFLSFTGTDFNPPALYHKELSNILQEYIRTQGFPELVGVSDELEIKKYVSEGIVDKILFKDIPAIFNIENVDALESLLHILMEEPGQTLDTVKLSKELGISRNTVSDYLRYLQESFLLKRLYNFSNNKRKMERSLKKYYASIVSPAATFSADTLTRSKVFEWLIVNQLDANFFWRDQQKHEVDIVLLKEKKVTPIEIKYGKIDTSGLEHFMEKFGIKQGYVISSDEMKSYNANGKKIEAVPAWKWLLDVRTSG